MRGTLALTVLLGATTLAIDAAAADLGGLLDRVRRKADEAAAETRELRRDVETTTDIEGKAEAEVDQAQRDVGQAVPTEQRIENRARGKIENTDAAITVRDIERDVDRTVTADERAEAAARSEVGRVEREVERQTDVEGRARAEVESSEPAVAAREAEREVNAVTSADGRAEAEIERDLESIERSIEDITDPL